MADKIEFELVSPERLLVSEPVAMVVVPGAEGDFGAMPGHSAMISSVRPGVIAVFENGAVTSRIFIAGGFAEVTPTRCTVLAEQAMPLDEIDREAVEKAIGDFRDEAAAARNDVERDVAEKGLAIAQAKLAAVIAPPY